MSVTTQSHRQARLTPDQSVGTTLVILAYLPGVFLPKVAYRGRPLATHQVEAIMEKVVRHHARPQVVLDGQRIKSMMVYRGRIRRIRGAELKTVDAIGVASTTRTLDHPDTLTDAVMDAVYAYSDTIEGRVDWPDFFIQLDGTVLSDGTTLAIPVPMAPEVRQVILRAVRLRRRRFYDAQRSSRRGKQAAKDGTR